MKRVFLLLVPLMLFFSPAHAAEFPADIYIFSNLGEGGAAVIQRELTEMGYDAQVFYDYSAEEVLAQMGEAAVFSYVGHGSPGRLVCRGDSVISARQAGGDNVFSLEERYFPAGLAKNRFVYYGSCNSDSYSPEYGRLTTYTAALGAESVVGFEGSVNSEVATYFEETLFSCLQEGETVARAIYLAKAESHAQYQGVFEYSKVDTAAVYGNGAVRIVPAAFGGE